MWQARASSGWAAQARQAIAQRLIDAGHDVADATDDIAKAVTHEGPRALPGGPDSEIVRHAGQANRAVDDLMEAGRPLLVVVPGTGIGPTTPGVHAVVRSLDREMPDGLRAVYLQYDGTIATATGRGLGATGAAEDALAGVLARISSRAASTNAPAWLVGESQGSWVVANVARENPGLIEPLQRVSLMSTPGLADTIALTDGELAGRMLHVAHTDDIVPGLFTKLKYDQVKGFARAMRNGMTLGDPSYPAHRYTADADDIARFLRAAQRPPSPVHHSSVHAPGA